MRHRRIHQTLGLRVATASLITSAVVLGAWAPVARCQERNTRTAASQPTRERTRSDRRATREDVREGRTGESGRRQRDLGRTQRPAGESDANMAVRMKLAQGVFTSDLAGVALEHVFGFLRDRIGVNIHVKWNVLQTVGIEKDTPVTVHLANVTFRKGLRTILDDIGGVNPLDYIVDGGVVTISTKDDLSSLAYVRTIVYDIRDLVDWTVRSEVENLMILIQENIDPASWRPTGEIAAVRHIHGTLVVTQTVKNHEAIQELFANLRATQVARPATPRSRARRADVQIKLVGTMKETCFDPAVMSLIAIAGLRDEVPRKPDDIIQELQTQLQRAGTIGVRNAIRLALKDLYKRQGQNEKVLSTLRDMLRDNDEALKKRKAY